MMMEWREEEWDLNEEMEEARKFSLGNFNVVLQNDV